MSLHLLRVLRMKLDKVNGWRNSLNDSATMSDVCDLDLVALRRVVSRWTYAVLAMPIEIVWFPSLVLEICIRP